MNTTDPPLHPQTIKKTDEEAQAALKAADAITLHRLYLDKTEAMVTLMKGMEIMAKNRDLLTHTPNNDSAISAMRDVALAAIDLAKQFASK